jgi:hypothetical protein
MPAGSVLPQELQRRLVLDREAEIADALAEKSASGVFWDRQV